MTTSHNNAPMPATPATPAAVLAALERCSARLDQLMHLIHRKPKP